MGLIDTSTSAQVGNSPVILDFYTMALLWDTGVLPRVPSPYSHHLQTTHLAVIRHALHAPWPGRARCRKCGRTTL